MHFSPYDRYVTAKFDSILFGEWSDDYDAIADVRHAIALAEGYANIWRSANRKAKRYSGLGASFVKYDAADALNLLIARANKLMGK